MFDCQRAFDLLTKISFVRMGGTEKELEAAHILQAAIKEAGLESHLEEFEVDASNVTKATLEVTNPFNEEIVCTGVKMSGNTPLDGLTKEFRYIEDVNEANLLDVEDKIVLINGRMMVTYYKKLVEAKVAGFISFSGSVYDEEETSDLDIQSLREKQYSLGKIPGVCIRAKDAQELIRKNPQEVRINLQQDEGKATSRNVVCEIKGTTYPNKCIAVTAHYDSVPFSKGAWDNASGAVGIMEIMHYFIKNPPKRTLKFVWCGSEEMGLLGSKAYCEAHKEELVDYVYNLNIDMIGVILGKEIAVSTAEQSLVDYISYFAKEIGIALTSRQGVYSSDSTPFADLGVPSTSFARLAPMGGAQIHCRKDVLDNMSPEAFASSLNVMIPFLERMANSIVFPIPRSIPDNMKLELDYYNQRKERPQR